MYIRYRSIHKQNFKIMSNSNVTMFDEAVTKSAFELKEGDVMEGGRFAFTDWSRGMQSYKCIEIATGKKYKTKIGFRENFVVIGTYKIEKTKDKFGNDVDNLVEGDLFVIDDNGKALCFRFERYTDRKIKAVSVFDENSKITIDKSFTVIKIENLI